MMEGAYLYWISDEEIAEAIAERKRALREAYLVEHPECVDCDVVTTGYSREGRHVNVDVKIVPYREPKMKWLENVRVVARVGENPGEAGA